MPALDCPPDIRLALAADPAVEQVFDHLAPSHRREYLSWIGEAKRAETRARRIAGMIDRLKPSGQMRRNGQT
jgi:uncharacterized protein YdeI (YjbR/CyaY-like superfamily)